MCTSCAHHWTSNSNDIYSCCFLAKPLSSLPTSEPERNFINICLIMSIKIGRTLIKIKKASIFIHDHLWSLKRGKDTQASCSEFPWCIHEVTGLTLVITASYLFFFSSWKANHSNETTVRQKCEAKGSVSWTPWTDQSLSLLICNIKNSGEIPAATLLYTIRVVEHCTTIKTINTVTDYNHWAQSVAWTHKPKAWLRQQR